MTQDSLRLDPASIQSTALKIAFRARKCYKPASHHTCAYFGESGLGQC